MPLNPVPTGYEPLINAEGELVYTPQANVESNLKNLGYRIPTSEDIKRATLKKDYGEGFGNELTAGVEGALSGATFGASRHIENALGIATPEEQALRKEFNPSASMVGEGLGIGASLFIPGAPVARLAGATTKLGVGVAEVLGGTVASKIAGSVIGSTVEGLAYGASAPISESALGDPTLTAQKAFAQIGLGGLLGGAIGGSLSGLGIGAKKLLSRGVSKEAETIVEGGLSSSEITKIAKTRGVDPEQVQEFMMNRERILNSPRLATKVDPVVEGQEAFTIEQAIRDSYEGLAPRIKELAEANQGMLEQSAISKAPKEIANIFENKMTELNALPVKGKQTNAAIERIQGFADQLNAVDGDLNAGQIKGIIGEIDSDLESFYAGKIGKSTTKEERVLLGLRRDLNETLKKDMTAAGFSEFETNLKEMSKLIDAQSRLEKSFGNATGYQRALSELSKADQGYKSGIPLVARGTKKGVDWLQALDDLGEISGQDFRQMYHDRALHSKLFPASAVGPEEITSWPQRLIKEGIDAALNPTDVPKKIFKGALSKTGGLFEQMKQKGIDDLLMGRSTNSGAVHSILGKMNNLSKKGSAFLEGPLSDITVPAGVKLFQFMNEHDSIDEADQKLNALMALEKAQKKADQNIQKAVQGVFSEEPIQAPKDKEFHGKSSEDISKHVEELRSQTNELVNQPEELINRLEQANVGMDHAPNITASLNMTAVRALQFLSLQMKALGQDEGLPYDAKYVPSKDQVFSLTKTLKYIHHPWYVLQDVASGRMTKEGKDVLNNVYPELYASMKADLMNEISIQQAKGKKMSMSKKLGMSYFLDMPLDSSMTPQAIASNQQTLMMPKTTPNQPNPTATNARNLNMAQNMMTPLQKVASRG